MSLQAHLRVQLTPATLGHHFLEPLLLECYVAAGCADAVELKNIMVTSAAVDQTELRLDTPPTVAVRFAHARKTLLNVFKLAFDVNTTGVLKDAVVKAVKNLNTELCAFEENKEAVRAEGDVNKMIIVLSTLVMAARSSSAAPPANVMWLDAVTGTDEGLTSFLASVRSFAASTGRRKVCAMMQMMILGSNVAFGAELVTDLDDVGAGATCTAEPARLLCRARVACARAACCRW